MRDDNAALDRQFKFYETPEPFTAWMAREVWSLAPAAFMAGVSPNCEPCVGDGAILNGIRAAHGDDPARRVLSIGEWVTNDVDERRAALAHRDATDPATWAWLSALAGPGGIGWTVTNPPFTLALPILEHALAYSAYGVASHVRCTLNEPLKRPGLGRSFLREHPPTMTLWLPRFPYQRSPTSGRYGSDAAPCVWLVWIKMFRDYQVVRYAPDDVIDAADRWAVQTGRRHARRLGTK